MSDDRDRITSVCHKLDVLLVKLRRQPYFGVMPVSDVILEVENVAAGLPLKYWEDDEAESAPAPGTESDEEAT